MGKSKQVSEPVIQHHVMMDVAGSWALLRTLDEDCLDQAWALARDFAKANHCPTIVATTVAEFSGE